jgi:Flp pilus assembly protein TadG
MKMLSKFRSDSRGNVAILFAIAAPVVLGGLAAAVTYSSGNSVKSSYQAAADSAVLAGATLPMSASLSDRKALAENTFAANVSVFANSEAPRGAVAVVASGDSNITVDATVTASMNNPFSGLIGGATIPITAHATAIKETVSICVLGLNASDKGSFDINGNPKFNADCAVQANTSDFSGMTQEGKARVTAKRFNVNGRSKVSNYYPPPTEGAPKVADPYASVPFPPYDDCSKGQGKKGLDLNSDATLEPGTYCGGIHIGSTAKVTLKPGIYVMVDGPFWVNGSASVSGKEVTVAFTGAQSTLEVWGDSSVNLTSPVSGTYKNFQFFQDRTSSSNAQLWVSIGGSAGGTETGATKLTFDGTAYFPTQNFWVFGNSVVNASSPGVPIVADKIWTQGNATFNISNANPRGLDVKAPQTDVTVRLIQ